MIIERINSELTATMKDREPERLEANREKIVTMRTLMAEIKTFKMNERRDPTDDEVYAILQKGIKQFRETLEKAKGQNQAGIVREDIAVKEEIKIRLFESYLPTPFSEVELAALVAEGILETGASGPKDMGKMMGWLKPKTQGRVDGRQLSEMVKQKLSAG